MYRVAAFAGLAVWAGACATPPETDLINGLPCDQGRCAPGYECDGRTDLCFIIGTIHDGAGGHGPAAGGASPSTGGVEQTGGATEAGGAETTGGAPASGGVPETGGAPSTGGAGVTGGATNTGGGAPTGGGGGVLTDASFDGDAPSESDAGPDAAIDPDASVGSGGATATGGDTGSGGALVTGGAPGSGGVLVTGGTPGSGGVLVTGGTPGSGGVLVTGGTPGSGGVLLVTGGAPGTGGVPANPPNCVNVITDGQETDIDCGGPTCRPCAPNASCSIADDCGSARCTPHPPGKATCAAPTCSDGVKNATETDVDCGPGCATCGILKKCVNNGDCASARCVRNLCVLASCTNGQKGGTETASDCGGPSCAPCSPGAACNVASDCTTSVCGNFGGKICFLNSCTDTVKNGAETDVDCGGGTCAKCPNDKRCAMPADCTSGNCVPVYGRLTCVPAAP
jgi:hypothetical protein